MPLMDTHTDAPHLFKVGAYSGDKLRVIRFEGSEGLSQVFRFSLDLASSDPKIDFDQVIGQPALLTARGSMGIRLLHGLVSSFEQTGKEGKWSLYRAEVVPGIWKLGLRTNCRIFQEKTIPDIIKEVLLDAGLTANQFRFALNSGRYKSRTYCVQYGESDLNFISRLMEQYGIWYYFEHRETSHVLVLGDDPSAAATLPGASSIRYHAPATAGLSTDEHIAFFSYHREIRCGAVKLRDFDFEKPRLTVTGDAQAKMDGKLEDYEYLGECRDSSERNLLAKVRLEEAQAVGQLGMGHSDCCRIIPGYRFTMEQCHRSDLNREYLTVGVTHKGTQSQSLGAETGTVANEPAYHNEFHCIPSDVPFRPAAITPRPTIQGPQTAIVVGPKGEEIYTDKHGRVKVQFHWDREGNRDEKSSCWVRVAQVWAGTSWGAMFIPRIGQEVLVEFLEGDPDQPIVTGRVYNGDNMPPYALPSEKTKSTLKSNSSIGGGGSNEIRFEDGKDKEEIFLHGQKDWTIAIENDKNQTVGHDETLAVTNNRTKTVGVDQSETVGANKTIQVGANHTESIGGAESITVGKGSAHTVALARALTIGGAYQVSVGAAMNETVGGAKAEEIGGAKTVVVGALSSENVAKNKSVDVGESITENASKNIGITAGDNVTISAGKNMVLNAGDQITIKTGSASITMKSNGDIVIKGGKITINASGDLALKGSKITQN
ncbi:type VI secretion system tip protein VgrG [Nitrospirales bacterium NOB]|nr:MAG: Rhs element Vgr protein [Nitrospira sp. OLB3]MBV6471047.1 Actin cross-linking toxin VgrG1 [Nitrospirota bacterium]MCE7965995.1 type VI secretion system tip protein VgrG [Nitrospira sp. NTP2]MDL1888832.1 type VI secretion system tip protein VgrG [Nitrospirales bacterium NOB]RIK58434.1 MAG: type VI secretion system tip protein VgrG [Nitrospira sp.]